MRPLVAPVMIRHGGVMGPHEGHTPLEHGERQGIFVLIGEDPKVREWESKKVRFVHGIQMEYVVTLNDITVRPRPHTADSPLTSIRNGGSRVPQLGTLQAQHHHQDQHHEYHDPQRERQAIYGALNIRRMQ